MSTASIPVDLLNPGQVFACLGLAELSEVLLGRAEGAFDWSDGGDHRFILRAGGDESPVAVSLAFLADAQVQALVPAGADLDASRWGIPSCGTEPGGAYPMPAPSTPATLPALLTAGPHSFCLSSWGEGPVRAKLNTGRDNVKFWAGAGGYPGVGLLRDALEAVSPKIREAVSNPFGLMAPQSSSFRFDWRRDYIPIDIGFSLNEHAGMQPRGYPLVEVLAAVGLSHARPERVTKLQYRYAVAGRVDGQSRAADGLLPLAYLRAALGGAPLPFPMRTFTMHLDWPGQENQARCITTVHEETAR